MTPLQRRRRLNVLSKQHHIDVLQGTLTETCMEGSPCGVFQWIEEPNYGIAVISVDPTSSDQAYLVALHEVAHGIVQRRGKRLSILQEEAAAWRWALENAGFTPDQETWAWLLKVLRNDLAVHVTEHFDLLTEVEALAR